MDNFLRSTRPIVTETEAKTLRRASDEAGRLQALLARALDYLHITAIQAQEVLSGFLTVLPNIPPKDDADYASLESVHNHLSALLRDTCRAHIASTKREEREEDKKQKVVPKIIERDVLKREEREVPTHQHAQYAEETGDASGATLALASTAIPSASTFMSGLSGINVNASQTSRPTDLREKRGAVSAASAGEPAAVFAQQPRGGPHAVNVAGSKSTMLAEGSSVGGGGGGTAPIRIVRGTKSESPRVSPSPQRGGSSGGSASGAAVRRTVDTRVTRTSNMVCVGR